MSATTVRNVTFVVLVWIGLALPVLAQGVGAIGGTVMDDSGGALPGVTVALSSPGVIGGDQTTATDERGTYQFTRLIPGRYSVKAELQGFQTAVQQNIEVNADRTSRADLTLKVGTLSETVTVAGEAPLLDTTSALNQTVMTREVLDTVPTGNDIWSIARLAPAIQLTKYDVGGREMFGQSSAFVHGSTGAERQYLIDGMSISSYSGGISFYVDSFSFSEMNFVAGNAPAESSAGGVVMNMISKTGTNAYHGSAIFSGTTHALESNNIAGALRDQLLAGVPAYALAANPNISLGTTIEHLFDLGGTIGGPIQRDRLWFFAAGRLGEVYQRRVGSYNADGTQLLSDNQMRQPTGKVSLAINPSNQLHYSYGWVHKGRYHVAGGPTVTEFFETRATEYNPSRNHLHLGRWTSVLSARMVLDVAAVTHYGQTNALPQKEVQNGDIPRYDALARINTVALGTYDYNSGQRSSFQGALTYVAGSQDLKVGYQYERSGNTRGGFSVSNYPSGFRAIYRNGVPDSVETYNTPIEYTRKIAEHAVYVQDKWRPSRKLTLNFGLRFGAMYGWIDDGESPLCQPATIFIEGRCFPAITGAPDFKGVVPRVSMIYDLFGNGRTALKFSANRYNVPSMSTDTGGAIVDRINPIRLTNDTRSWTDVNRDGLPQLNELGPSTGFNLGTTNRYADDLSWPYTNEISAEIEQQFPGPLVVQVGYYYRGLKNQIGLKNLAVPMETYTPIQVTEVNSGRQVTVYNQAAALRGRFDVVWANYPEFDGSFHGVDLAITKRMSDRWMLMGSLSLGKSETDIYVTSDLNNPNLTHRRGPTAQDVPVFFKLSGAYELPYGLSVGFSGQYFRGWPETTTVRVASNTVRLTQVNQNIVVEPRGTSRLPDVKMVDLNIRKSFRRGGLTLEPRMDIFNLFNAAAITQRIAQLGPTYGRAIEVLGARLLKFGVNVTF